MSEPRDRVETLVLGLSADIGAYIREQLALVERRLDAIDEKLTSHERRISRHAEHLGKLEDRMQRQERGE
jgi:hypothetical protein